MEPTQRIRQTAHKIPIQSIINGRYVRGEGEFSPNYIELDDLKISRLNIIGIIVSIDRNETDIDSFVIDDGTSRINVRSFEQMSIPSETSVGDVINIIGRPREFGSEKYLMPEIIKKTSQEWMRVRKLEIEKIKPPEKEEVVVEDIEITENIKGSNENTNVGILANHEKIIRYIKENDHGSGLEIEEILKKLQTTEKMVEDMLKEGELFENIPGRVKVLE